MTRYDYTLFDTAIGRCGVAWTPRGIAALQLPEADASATRRRLLERAPDASPRHAPPRQAPPRDVMAVLTGISDLTRGVPVDLTAAPLDFDRVPPFHRRVYTIARAIAAGTTATYGELAARLGAPDAARSVGQALGRNPFAIIVPCHRVVAAGGKLGGFSAGGGIAMKLRLLNIEARRDAPGLFGGSNALPYDGVAAVEHLRKSDPRLAVIIDRVGPLRLEMKESTSVFGALAEAIAYQQLSGRAAQTIFARFSALVPWSRSGLQPAQILRVSDAKIRGAGLSQAKLLAIRDLATRCASGLIPTMAEMLEMADEEVVDRLTQVRGVGRWTAQMLLIFRLGRPDVLPVDDYGVRKGYAVAYRRGALPSPRELEQLGRCWQPYRSVASWYFWRAAELDSSLK